MLTRSILIKLDNEFVYLSDSIKIGYDKTNLPKQYFSFKNERAIYFEVQQLSFEKNSSTLIVKVINYTSQRTEAFSTQVPEQNINALEFEKMDWMEFQSLVFSYTLSKLQGTFYNIQLPMLPSTDESGNAIKRQRTLDSDFFKQNAPNLFFQSKREPTIETFQTVIKVKFENSKFHDGYISFTAKLKEYGIVKDFSISNIHLKQEFEYIKSWFVKKLGKSFIVTFNITVRDRKLDEVLASSEDIELINQELIDSVKISRITTLTKAHRSKNESKLIFDNDEVFSALEDTTENPNVFKSTSQNIIEILISTGLAKNVKQLEFLSKHIQSTNDKIRFTLRPHFGFIFKVEKNERHFFIWELLNSHATYIWDTSSNIETFNSLLEDQISFISNNGREEYKRYYKSLQYRGFNFITIDHSNLNLTEEERFDAWKEKLYSVINDYAAPIV